MKTSGVTRQSAFYGKYFMLGYFGICLVTVALANLPRRYPNQE
jgi:hypothetical protein